MTDSTVSTAPKIIELGTGVLTWNAEERRRDRYGTVFLMQKDHTSLTRAKSPSLVERRSDIAGKAGILVAEIIQVRDSTHVGDLFRNVYPRRPKLGAKIVLGTGTIFFEPAHDGGYQVGLRPDNGRDKDWLKIRALYDCHEQTVRLLFEPLG